MRAYRFSEWKQWPELVEVATPEPGPGEVLIKVGGSGACHSDLHVTEFDAGLLPWTLPFTLGHETAGWVEALGSGVTGVEVGEPVAVYGPWGCGRCRTCRTGSENYCENAATIGASGGGLGRDGGMAEYMLVPSPRLLVPLGDLDPRDAAPLGDAALTPYHAVKRSLPKLGAGSTAVAIGVGGLGHVGIQLLREMTSAQVIAVDIAEDKLRLAKDVGADHAIHTDEALEEIRGLTNGRGAEVVIDFVGNDATLALAVGSARVGADVALVGIGGGTFPFGFFGLPYEVSLATTYWGSVTELMEVLDLARAGKITVHTERFGLDKVDDAYRRLAAGGIEGRAVITPHG